MAYIIITILYAVGVLCAISGIDRLSPPNLLIFAGCALIAAAILHAKEREIEENKKR